jgi:hypothetical protein
LPQVEEGTVVVGIKYELLDEMEPETKAGKKKPSTPSKPKPKRETKPALKEFEVTVLRSATIETSVVVKAGDVREAESLALQKTGQKPFVAADVRDSVKSVIQR